MLPEGNGEKSLLHICSACFGKKTISIVVRALIRNDGEGICSQLRLSLSKENRYLPRESCKKIWLVETDMEKDQCGVHYEDQDPRTEVCLLPGQVESAARHLGHGLLPLR